uniref:Uncharacterized protein n=1 Tax=Anguilla anguilla TaxID=7936 RepID=A0A0E9PFE7_ANGAN
MPPVLRFCSSSGAATVQPVQRNAATGVTPPMKKYLWNKMKKELELVRT